MKYVILETLNDDKRGYLRLNPDCIFRIDKYLSCDGQCTLGYMLGDNIMFDQVIGTVEELNQKIFGKSNLLCGSDHSMKTNYAVFALDIFILRNGKRCPSCGSLDKWYAHVCNNEFMREYFCKC